MSVTAAPDGPIKPSAGLPELALAPLPADGLSPAVQKLMASPTPAKLMAAKGISPLRPAELLISVYQLSFDADAAVKTTAEAAPGSLPDKILEGTLGDALPPQVLHFFALRLTPPRTEAMVKILYNQATADETFVVLATRLAERELEIIFENEMRILRCPAILQALYYNPQARMSSVNRAIELCARNLIRLEGIPAYDELVKSIREDAGAVDPDVVDQTFAAALDATGSSDPASDASGSTPVASIPATTLGGATAAASAAPVAAGKEKEKDGRKRSVVINFSKLKLYEKMRLATLGNEYCRQTLVRDPNRLVAMAAIRSPKITDSEIVKTAGNRVVAEEVIRYIASQRDFLRMYAVKLSLVQNPKCPVGISVRFLSQLMPEDLKNISRSKSVPAALSTTAKKLVQAKGG
jgi:hypothetical protein